VTLLRCHVTFCLLNLDQCEVEGTLKQVSSCLSVCLFVCRLKCCGNRGLSCRLVNPSFSCVIFLHCSDVQLNSTMRLISGTLRSTPLPWLPVLSNIEPAALRRKAATDKLVEKIVKHDSWPIQPDILSPLLRLTSRKPLWLDLQPVDIKSRWSQNWKSAQVVNSHLVCDPSPTIRQPGLVLPTVRYLTGQSGISAICPV